MCHGQLGPVEFIYTGSAGLEIRTSVFAPLTFHTQDEPANKYGGSTKIIMLCFLFSFPNG